VLDYARRALPLQELYVGGAGLLALLWLVGRWPQELWQLAGVSAALVGAVAGCLFDEPAASIVDTLPRGRRWRTTARLLPVVLLTLLWVVAASMLDPADIGRSDVLRLQGVGAILLGVAAATWLRRRGRATPGIMVASSMLLVLSFAAVMNPIDAQLPLFPYGPVGDWAASRLLWAGLASAAAIAIVSSCSDGWPTRASRCTVRGARARVGRRPNVRGGLT
jgi:hypothetical protein